MISVSKKNTANLFLFGKVKALEKDIFDIPRLYGLCESSDTEAFLTDLADTKYHSYISDKPFERAVYDKIFSDYDHLRSKLENTEVLDALMINLDIMNFISKMRDYDKEEDFQEAVYKSGWWTKDKFPDFFRKAKAVMEKKAQFNNQLINEELLEKICIDIWADIYLPRIHDLRIVEYWRDIIDSKNFLKTLSSSNKFYYAGGNISISFWKKFLVEEDWPDKLRQHKTIGAVQDIKEKYLWEKTITAKQTSRIKEMKKQTFNMEPVFAYLATLKYEAENLHMIYTGLNMGFESSVLKDNLNLSYV